MREGPPAPPPIELRRLPTEISYEDARMGIGNTLRAWQFVHNQAVEAERANKFSPMDRQATATAAGLARRLGINRFGDAANIEFLERLVTDGDFTEAGLLTQFLAYQLWLQNMRMQGDEEYAEYRERLIKPIKLSLATSAESTEVQGEDIRVALASLIVGGEREVAVSVILQEGISPEARLRLAVELINVLGVVEAIEELLPFVEREEIKELLARIQGDVGEAVMPTLSSVYQAIEFQQYALNNRELTKKESELIQNVVKQYAEEQGIDPRDVNIADIGGGTGRLALALHEAGLGVTAYEFEEKHTAYMKKQAPELAVVQADWHNMPLSDASESEGVDVFYCLGRTILHNNTPEKMARFFDEMNRITKNGGVGLIDIPEVGDVVDMDDEYARNIKEYGGHLESLGVLPQVAKNLYDGPDKDHRYNRMAVTPEQFGYYAELFGFMVEEVSSEEVGGEGGFDNSYYKISKVPDFDIADMDPREMLKGLYAVGLYRPGVDYNRIVHAWQAPLGAPFVFTHQLGANIGKYRDAIAEGRPISPIRADVHQGKLTFRTTLDF